MATVDGAATVAGRTAPMSDAADRQLFHQLRTRVDAVLVGAGTVRAERYGRLVRDAGRREQRAARGLEPDPLAVVVSRSLALTPDCRCSPTRTPGSSSSPRARARWRAVRRR